MRDSRTEKQREPEKITSRAASSYRESIEGNNNDN